MRKDYISEIDNVIYDWVVNNNKEPIHIIMNPNTWQHLGSQMGINDEYKPYLNDFIINNKYRGYEIFRSFDIEENKFILG